jgi:hypothetical protein
LAGEESGGGTRGGASPLEALSIVAAKLKTPARTGKRFGAPGCR